MLRWKLSEAHRRAYRATDVLLHVGQPPNFRKNHTVLLTTHPLAAHLELIDERGHYNLLGGDGSTREIWVGRSQSHRFGNLGAKT
jgi:hypothetical protein